MQNGFMTCLVRRCILLYDLSIVPGAWAMTLFGLWGVSSQSQITKEKNSSRFQVIVVILNTALNWCKMKWWPASSCKAECRGVRHHSRRYSSDKNRPNHNFTFISNKALTECLVIQKGKSVCEQPHGILNDQSGSNWILIKTAREYRMMPQKHFWMLDQPANEPHLEELLLHKYCDCFSLIHFEKDFSASFSLSSLSFQFLYVLLSFLIHAAFYIHVHFISCIGAEQRIDIWRIFVSK